jgi:murein DD-endopeptidase MepM/ murein hydrolase activator NlpD
VKNKVAKADSAKTEVTKAPASKAPLLTEPPVKTKVAKNESPKPEPVMTQPVKAPLVKEEPAAAVKPQVAKNEPAKTTAPKEPVVSVQTASGPLTMAFTKLADGFDFPVGKPEAEGYYKARGFRTNGHMGEDWDGIGGGDTDLGDPIYAIGDGIVVFARDVHLGWGNVVIIRHAYREKGAVKYIDSLYGHLNTMLVGRGQRVFRGQQIATMGTAHGQYDAHLHLEIRKNIEIGLSKSKFGKNLSNYYQPTEFIESHRHLSGGGANYRVAMNTFAHDSAFHFDTARDFSSHKRSTSESSAALRRALTSTGR